MKRSAICRRIDRPHSSNQNSNILHKDNQQYQTNHTNSNILQQQHPTTTRPRVCFYPDINFLFKLRKAIVYYRTAWNVMSLETCGSLLYIGERFSACSRCKLILHPSTREGLNNLSVFVFWLTPILIAGSNYITYIYAGLGSQLIFSGSGS